MLTQVDTGRRLGWSLAATGMLLVSTDSLFIRLSRGNPWDIVLVVSAYAVLVQGILTFVIDGTSPIAVARRSNAGAMMTIAALGGVSQICFISAMTTTSVANVVMIVATAPLLAAIAGWVLLRERTSRRVWIANGISFMGIAVVVSGSLGGPSLKGDGFALAAVAAFSITIALWRRHPDLSRYATLTFSGAMVIAVAFWFGSFSGHDARFYAATAAMGLVFNPLGRIAYTNAPRFAPPAEVALFAPVETLAAPTWAWLTFGEVPSGTTLTGGAVILGAVLYGTFASR